MTEIKTTRAGLPHPLRLVLVLAVLLASIAATFGSAAAYGASGAVYTSTNSPAGNEVIVFRRAGDGALTEAGHFATGGNGTGAGLGNQGGVTLSENGRWLLVVNAASDSLTAFQVRSNGLARTDVEASGGDMPLSVTISGNIAYVLNAGSNTISGFRIDHRGNLIPLAGSTRNLSAGAVDPAQIAFSPNGRLLAVTEKTSNTIDTFTVARNGLASGPNSNPSAGMTPFGFAFTPRGDLIVSEAFGGAPDASALSSYDVDRDGDLHVVSASLGTTETAACWVVVTRNGKYTYTTNTGSASVTGYAVGRDGSLTLLDADGVTGATGTTPIDLALSRNSQFLYTLNSSSHSISAFVVNADGSLTSLGEVGSLPVGTNGLAAR